MSVASGPSIVDLRELRSAGVGNQLFVEAARRLRRDVAFDGAAWFGTDPSTVLPTSPLLTENVVHGNCQSYWDREFSTEDFLLFRDLARSPSAGGTLYDVTDGNPARSARYRDFLEPQRYGDELRAVFRVGTSTWGVVDLFRNRDREPFTARDVEQVTTLGRTVAFELAELATSNRHAPATRDDDRPGTALFDEDNVGSFDAQAQRWLAELAPSDPERPSSDLLRAPILSVVNLARTVAAGRDRGPASARLRTVAGRWLNVHASCLRSPGATADTVVVIIEPAHSSQIAPILVEAYCLTPREQQITQAVAQGSSNARIAADLYLSPHTVRDHLKAIFAKVSVSSRGELVAKLFAEHYGPAIRP